MSIKSGILVILQTISMIYLLICNNPITLGFGFLYQILGIVIGLWGILTIRIGNFNIQPELKSKFLIKSGPYKWIRNPMYAGVLLFYVPIVIKNFNWRNGLIFIVLFISLILKIYREEQFLKERFGKDYTSNKNKSKRLIPYFY